MKTTIYNTLHRTTTNYNTNIQQTITKSKEQRRTTTLPYCKTNTKQTMTNDIGQLQITILLHRKTPIQSKTTQNIQLYTPENKIHCLLLLIVLMD